jgi:hypothetical protein
MSTLKTLIDASKYEKSGEGENAIIKDLFKIIKDLLGEEYANVTIQEVLSDVDLFKIFLAKYTENKAKIIHIRKSDTPCGKTEKDAISGLTSKVSIGAKVMSTLSPEKFALFQEDEILLIGETVAFIEKYLTPSQIEVIGSRNLTKLSGEDIFQSLAERSLDLLTAIGGENIAKFKGHTGITVLNAILNYLPPEFIRAIGGENLVEFSFPLIWISSIKVHLSPEQLSAVGGKNFMILINYGQADVKILEIIKVLPPEYITAVGGKNLCKFKDPEVLLILISSMLPSRVAAIKGLNIAKLSNPRIQIPAIGKNLSSELIRSIGSENLDKFIDPTTMFPIFKENANFRVIEIIGGKNLAKITSPDVLKYVLSVVTSGHVVTAFELDPEGVDWSAPLDKFKKILNHIINIRQSNPEKWKF